MEKEPEEGAAHWHGQSLGRAVGDNGLAEVEANPIGEGARSTAGDGLPGGT